MKPENKTLYNHLVENISLTYTRSKIAAFRAVNTILLDTYWTIGQHIVEFEQGGKSKATYGDELLKRLSKDLSLRFGKGFSQSNLYRFKQFYQLYSISETVSHKSENGVAKIEKGISATLSHKSQNTNKQEDTISATVSHKSNEGVAKIEKVIPATVSHQLSWSHYVELLKIEDSLERSFYEKQAVLENWSIRELIRQKKTSLFLRLAQGKTKEEIQKLSKTGKVIEHAEDILKDTYIFEFLKIPEPYQVSENNLETKLIDQLHQFLLELGKGFAFVGRQYRITLANRHHYVDLLFYHCFLKCYVLIDLKREEAGYEDVGQMNMYLGYIEAEVNQPNDNPPIGIILAREKDELQIKYAMSHTNSQLFVKKYQLYLPNEEELRREIEYIYQEEKKL